MVGKECNKHLKICIALASSGIVLCLTQYSKKKKKKEEKIINSCVNLEHRPMHHKDSYIASEVHFFGKCIFCGRHGWANSFWKVGNTIVIRTP